MSIGKFVMSGVATTMVALGAVVPATAAAAPAVAVAEAGTGSADATSGSGTLVLLIQELFKPCPFSSTVCPADN
ncbi:MULTISPECIES: hypothetical protein [Nocardia]|uniref:hypothetical protein n=1 Tax=Nocardia TaxID=1817 RepID=UPI0006FECA3A|nr:MULTISPECIES: hypothetical protein [Nocardia]KQY38731.1 hypothetical protein ASD42_10275 [Nocardia sp. Root136]